MWYTPSTKAVTNGIQSLSDSTDGIFHTYRRVTFRAHDMRMDFMKNRFSEEITASYTYTCTRELPNNKFLAIREDEYNENKYTCVQFIFRDTNVVQLKFGALQKKLSNKLCNDNQLEMVDAPLVYYHNIGGYWDERRNENSSYKVISLGQVQ